MFSGLRDFAFGNAPGEWTIWRCRSCDTAYLDPRPTAGSIGRAYSRYYTNPKMAGAAKLGPVKSLRRCLASGVANDYINRTYGYHLAALPLRGFILRTFLRKKRSADHKVRHLQAPSNSDSNLLDAGCGNGEFLKLARRLGFRSVGVDPDEHAILAANRARLDARLGTFPGSGLPENSFDHITVNHVLEHLHQPLEALEEMRKLLKPGGRLWISQPNLGANGLKEFGIYWRGLEPPRHLTLFTIGGMRLILERCGFVEVELLAPPPVASFYYRQSLCQRSGIDPYGTEFPPSWDKVWEQRVKDADESAEADPRRAESLTMIARRPQ
jgi:2-polyprenyl-3-methyl-5-hydroxy-6-metoxy-1,4-benzoquinol methylase